MNITDEMIKKICSETIYRRGMDYFKEGRVHIRKRDENEISAVVDGEKVYYVQVKTADDRVKDFLCTCPYYQTMQSACKHIVAVMKQRQTEMAEGENFVDENDKIAAGLCRQFEQLKSKKEKMYARFHIRVVHNGNRKCTYTIELRLGSKLTTVPIYCFLDAYIKNEKFKIETGFVYSAEKFYFGSPECEIINLLAEIYQNMNTVHGVSANSNTQMSIGAYSAKRIFDLLKNTDFDLSVNSVLFSDLRVRKEDPDILVDVTAEDEQIHICISESGIALVPDGSSFFYEGDMYCTSGEWQNWFMPIYNSLLNESRTQIRFKGDNAAEFASKVLPVIRNRHGVVCCGLDDVVINAKPTFEVYLDKYKNGIAAVVKAVYGGVSFRIPGGGLNDGKIVVRDEAAEKNVLSFFDNFNLNDGVYTLEDNDLLYSFIANGMRSLSAYSGIYYSDAFGDVKLENKLDIKGKVRYNEHLDLLETEFETNLTADEIRGILKAVQLKKKFYRLKDGSFLNIENNSSVSIIKLLENIDFDDDCIDGAVKPLPRQQMMYLFGLDDKNEILGFDESFLKLKEKVKSIKADIPRELEDVLREYQKFGVHWLKQLADMGFGGILADDMGLGKTIQVIAFVCAQNKSEPSLIIAPSALVYNWRNEIRRFAPKSSVLIVDGTKDDRTEIIKGCEDYDFVITSYPLIRRDIELYKNFEFAYCFIDEAQYIKNANTMNAKSVKKVKAKNYFALTGTPIENSLSELWSIFDFVMKGYLGGHRDFENRYERPAIKDGDEAVLADLRDKIKPFVLRRMKNEVLEELPEKMENVMYAELDEEQKKLYAAFVAEAKNEVIGYSKTGEYAKNKLRILALLMRLRQICCHPSLFDEKYSKDSGKLLMLEELLNTAISGGHRVLVFSQFTSMLEIIKKRLDKLKISYFYIDGTTAPQERSDLSERFNGGEKDVFLISLKAGGTGLNLVGADTVIHYDPWWNPAVMDQASDRAYRIGQKKAVQVIKLAAKGTIEEKMIQLQEKKRSLADGIITANQTMLSHLTKEEVLTLLE